MNLYMEYVDVGWLTVATSVNSPKFSALAEAETAGCGGAQWNLAPTSCQRALHPQ